MNRSVIHCRVVGEGGASPAQWRHNVANVIYITCRTLASSTCAHGYRHIDKVRWVRDNGESEVVDRQGMVNWLNANSDNEAYTRPSRGPQARVYVRTCGDHQYIESVPDNTKVDNLRELPNSTAAVVNG
jgi:hypothetical protein